MSDSGRPAYYRPKIRTIQIGLTRRASDSLEAAVRRNKKSRSDIVDHLLRHFHREIKFTDKDPE